MSRQDRFSWFASQHRRQRRLKTSSRALSRRSALSRRLRVELLEDRRMLAVVTVNSQDDTTTADTELTLREAILLVNEGGDANLALGRALTAGEDAQIDSTEAFGTNDIIDFDATLAGGTILLDNGLSELAVTASLTIDASSLASGLTIDASDPTPGNPNGDGIRIFNISDGTSGLIDVEIVALTLTGGDSLYDGGAIRSTENLTISSSAITGNSTSGGFGGRGGGIYSRFGDLIVTNSSVSGNTGSGSGGGIDHGDGDLTITGSTISGNTASGPGGGIMITFPPPFDPQATTITNSTISGNTAGSGGGGIYNAGDLLVLQHSTITDNTAPDGYGSGVASQGDANTTTEVTHTIIAGNTNSDVDVVSGAINSFVSLGYNLIGTSNSSPDALANFTSTGDQTGVTNPLLGPLSNNGGPTETHALQPTSPAIDAGDLAFDPNAFVPPLDFDQRGASFMRVVDVTGGGPIIDIGAHELQSAPDTLVVDTILDELDGDFGPGDLSLREAIVSSNFFFGAQTITFNAALGGGTILLDNSLGQQDITQALTIDASSLASGLTIDASDPTPGNPNGDGIRIFNISDGTSGLIDVEIVALTLTGGDSLYDGGAIRSTENLTISSSAITGNSTSGGFGGRGGGIYSRFGDLIVTNSSVSGNTGSGSGGGIDHGDGDLTITGSTISGNTASGPGGGIMITFPPPFDPQATTITNSTISGNTAGSGGGGIYNAGDLLVLQHSTITDNTAPDGYGSGVASQGDANTTTEVTHTIIAGNTNSDVDVVSGAINSFVSLGYNLIGTSNSSPDALANFTSTGDQTGVTNPLLGPLSNNGGPTETHALQPTSPAIDAGDLAAVGGINGVPSLDQRGPPFARVAQSTIDIGAYELHVAPAALVVSTTVDELDGDFSAGDLSLREAVGWSNIFSGPDTITFDASLSGTTIDFNQALGDLSIEDDLTIDASSLASQLTIDAGDGTDGNFGTGDGIRIFDIHDGSSGLIDVEIINLRLTGGDSLYDGGAIRSRENLTVTNSTISANAAVSGGGGIFSYGGHLNVDSSTISLNLTKGDLTTGFGEGGGISSRDGELTVANSTVSLNSTTGVFGEGGGIAVFGGGISTITDSLVSGNSVSGAGAGGGGISSRDGELTVANSTITGNSTSGSYAGFSIYKYSGGGGIYSRESSLTITGSTISNNSTTGHRAHGGGILNFSGDSTITGSTISNNSTSGSTSFGGGVITTGALTLNNSTISGNDAADGEAGGIWVNDDPVVIAHSILANNTAGRGSPNLRSETGALSVDYSLIADTSGSGVTTGTGAGNVLDVNPLLAPLADYGGPTQTYGLLPGSPAIDAGDLAFDPNAFVPPLDFDQRGTPFAREVDVGGGGDRIDIGAFELQSAPTSLVVDTLVDELDADFSAGDLSLREAIGWADTFLGSNTITFDASLDGGTILLDNGLGELAITDSVLIDASSLVAGLTIDASGNDPTPTVDQGDGSRVFRIDDADGGNTIDVEIVGLALTGGDVSGRGGAILSLENLTITDSIISGNSTVAVIGSGGGIFGLGGDLEILRSTVSGNSASGAISSGGGVAHYYGNLTVTGSTISGNFATGRGGGIVSKTNLLGTETTTVTNSTISGNTTDTVGGGIYNRVGLTVIQYSTITDNSAPADGDGSGVASWATTTTETRVTSSIIAGNTHSDVDVVAGGGINSFTSLGYNLIGTSSSTPSALGNFGSNDLVDIADPKLGPLADHGGPTHTHNFLPGSPAIDAGNPAFDPNAFVPPLDYDQRGAPFDRVFDIAGGGDRIDIGAYEQEVSLTSLVVDTLVDELDADFSAGDLSLREAIGWADTFLGSNTITFDGSLNGGTILLDNTLGELVVTDSVVMDASNLVVGLTIDGNDPTPVGPGGDGIRLFNIDDGNSDVTAEVELVGFTLTGGDVIGSGGAIRTRENLTLTNVTVQGNAANGYGNGGGGINVSNASLTITGTTITGNVQQSFRGGGIFGLNANVDLSASTISNNTAHDSGAGIYFRNGNLNVTESTISGNSTSATSATGSGIYNHDGDLTVTASTISGNTATGNNALGGGIYSAGGDLTVTTSTISGNTMTGLYSEGGGIFSSTNLVNTQTTITYSTISGNSVAGLGGGILNSQGLMVIRLSTITNNTAALLGGGGVESQYHTTTGTRTEVRSSIIAGNFGDDVVVSGSTNSFLSNGYNLIGTGNALSAFGPPEDQLIGAADPGLSPLADNGGPTETHTLLPGSPAIDLGNPFFSPPPDFDQRGAPFVREFDGDGAGGARIDIGAYELQTLSLVVDTLVDESDGDYSVGDVSLREAVELTSANPGDETITFDASLDGGTILLDNSLGELVITDVVIIDASNLTAGLTIDANDPTPVSKNGDGIRIFNIDNGNTTGDLDVQIKGLTLTGGDAASTGGAIYSRENLFLTNVVITGNAAIGFSAGAIRSRLSELTITDSVIAGNSTSNDGGAIETRDGDLFIIRSTISGNTSTADGGGIYAIRSNVEITDSTLSGNMAGDDGGGVYIKDTNPSADTSLTLTGSTLSGNTASGDGGGVYSIDAPLTFSFSTIADNTATNNGGGIYADAASSLALNHTIVGDNSASSGADILSVPSVTADYSLIENAGGHTITGGVGTNITGADPMLGGLVDNGGPTQTHALLAGSPAIDAGDLAAVAGMGGVPLYDQRGLPFSRVQDGDGDFSSQIDIGAVERQTLNYVVDNLVDENDGNFDPGDLSLREALSLANFNPVANTITFDGSLDGGTILLDNGLGELAVTDSVSIDAGSLTGGLTIDAANGPDGNFATGDGVRIFKIDDGTGTRIDVEIVALTLTGGDVAGDGGAIFSVENLTMTASTIAGNATTGGTDGGGIFSSSGNLTVIGSTISGNKVFGSGGGIFKSFGNMTITDSTISDNMATQEGGGIHSSSTLVSQITTISNSTISGNKTFQSDGGGIYNAGGLTSIRHSTVTDNEAPLGYGGGVASHGNSSTETNVRSTIIAGNSNGDVDFVSGVTNSFDSSSFNLIGFGNATAEFSNTGIADPGLDPLADNGGPTLTHALDSGSPAIDAGSLFDAAGVGDVPLFDQRDTPFTRVFDNDGVGGPRIDIGAYERQTMIATVLVVDTLADEIDGDHSTGNFSLREAVDTANGSVADTITFDAGLDGDTILLDNILGELLITNSLSIDASDLASGLVVDAGNGTDNNPGTGDGIRIFNIDDGTSSEINVSIIGLTLDGGDVSGTGGAISSRENLTVFGSTISGNSTSGDVNNGGGIYSRDGDLIVTLSTISGNSTSGLVALGGGIANTSGNLTVSFSSISGNFTSGIQSHGGGISSRFGNLTVSDSTVSGNFTLGTNANGAAIATNTNLLDTETTTITNSTITGNTSAGSGGGLYNQDGLMVIQSSTITSNTAPAGKGSGIASRGNSDTRTEVASSIVAGNSQSDVDLVNGTTNNSFTSNGYNLIGTSSSTPNGLDNFTGTGDQTGVVNPGLGPLTDNGGPTLTHALLPGSTALDAGNSTLTTDQRGLGVPIDLTGFVNAVGGNGSDVGAYEAQAAPSADFVDDDVITGLDFLAWQRGFGTTSGATRSDGNSDDDSDVDTSDLAAWIATFGQVETTPLAAVGSGEEVVSSASVASAESAESGPSAASPSNDYLVDAAIAWSLAGQWSEEEAFVVDEAPAFDEVTSDLVFASSDLAPAMVSSAGDSLVTTESEAESTSNKWLTDELLERVFGYTI